MREEEGKSEGGTEEEDEMEEIGERLEAGRDDRRGREGVDGVIRWSKEVVVEMRREIG